MTATRIGRDASCRYARSHAEHLCIDNRGEPVRVGGECFAETRSQLIEQGRVLQDAEKGLPA